MTIYTSLGYGIAKAHKAMRAHFQEILRPYGVTVPQFEVMRILKTESGLTAAQLVERIISDSSTIMSILQRLKSKSLIRRKADESDRRQKLIYLTKEGELLLDNLAVLVDRHYEQMHDRCTPEELEIFRRVLSKLCGFCQTDKENI